jgi:hypothetical protein
VKQGPDPNGPDTGEQMRGMVETAVMTAALLVATTWSAGPVAAAMVDGLVGSVRATIDRTRLPLGDSKVATSATVGSVWACQTSFNGGGAFTDGPWIKGDGTYDYASKAVVDGEVSWPSQFTIELNGSTRTVVGNDLPSHTTGVYPIAQSDDAYRYDRNPNSIKEQSLRLTLPAAPTVAGQPSCLPGGPIGVLLSGSVLFNALDAGGRDAVAHEAQDHCQGHPQPEGMYHYHNLSSCLDDGDGGHSPLMGYAFDGFGIYGHHGEGGATLTNTDLDACHGHSHAITWDGQTVELYHCHATAEYPYTLGCFKGQANRQLLAGGGAGAGSGAGGPGAGLGNGAGGPRAGGPGVDGPGGGPGQGQEQPPADPSQGGGQGMPPGGGQFMPPPPPGMGPRGGRGLARVADRALASDRRHPNADPGARADPWTHGV